MKPGIDYIGVGVGALIIRDGRVLLLKRKKKPEVEHWSTPGGKVEMYEEVEDALIRELREELGVEVQITCLLGVCNHIMKSDNQCWLSPIFLVNITMGNPENKEPDKHFGMEWFDLDNLPKKMSIIALTSIESYLKLNKPIMQFDK